MKTIEGTKMGFADLVGRGEARWPQISLLHYFGCTPWDEMMMDEQEEKMEE